ncbi:hypothetical protein Nepgr_008510 [Nepenthes gracilis]|uniref:Myb-like domain-containing protein n=1 Tax=Nepenthes gracilis TaxID=150966 RepID=A0AAD3S966_NEPGR|nr:hypothetical protein Nepgr_008510 [Nepenthes gracilis]
MLENPVGAEISGERRENEGGGASVAAGEFRRQETVDIKAESGYPNSALNGNNRWPQQETMALLKIRSEMDFAFRDSVLKAPLWDEVSRKLGGLGYHRSGKKCKEKFENLYKYHRRSKRCQYTRSNGKAYRFFDQLEALDHHQISFPSSATETIIASTTMTAVETSPVLVNPQNAPENIIPCLIENLNASLVSGSSSTSSSSQDDFSEGGQKRKRKLMDIFEKITKSVLEKQEDLQKKFLEALEKCEHKRIAREEAWKAQEMARIKREQELLMQERSIAAAKDAAVVAFLQKVSEQGRSFVQVPEQPSGEEKSTSSEENNNVRNATQLCSPSSRWPKDEVEAFIRLRANMELQYQDHRSKGPLWEDVSAAMKRLGYDRSAKRCKEKWENINKYFRRVRESNKKPMDSKTCPYFQQLEALYQVKAKKCDNNSEDLGGNLRAEKSSS